MKKTLKTLVAILALLAIFLSVFSGCSKYASKDDDEKESSSSKQNNKDKDDDQDDDESSHSAAVITIEGDDIFDGERFSEMLWGYYEADCYDYNGSNEDANEFLTDMEYIKVETNQGNTEFAALPLSLHAGKYSHFMGSFNYEGEYYEPYTEKGKSMFRKAYIAEQGDMTEEQFRKMEYIMELDVVSLVLAFRNGSTYMATLAYEIKNDTISLYEFTVDDDYNIDISSEPITTLNFLHSGNKLTLAYKGVQRDYLASGLKETDPSFTCNGFALNAAEKYEDLEGFSFFQFGADDDISVYVDLSSGDTPIDPVMEFDPDTCEFSLSWQECWTDTLSGIGKKDDPRTISGTIVPCTNYGFTDYTGFFLFIDGNCYRYLISQKEFDERMYSDIQSGRINLVIVKDLSRFGRNYVDTGMYVQEFTDNNIRFIAADDNYDSLVNGDDLLFPIKNVVNEMYARDVSKKTKAAKKAKARDGQFIGSKAPFGYKIDPANFLSMGQAMPFEGWEVYGKCVKTIVNGITVYSVN